LGHSITTVLFDADGVIQTPAPGWLDRVADLSGHPVHREEFLSAVFAAERPALTGVVDFRLALGSVLERWGSPAVLEEAVSVWHLIEPQKAVLQQIAGLRMSGLRVALATNQQAERAAYMTDVLGYASLFDDLFYSCELGFAKPDPAFFGSALERLQQSGSSVLFVDDHPANVESARKAGLNASVYDLETGPDGLRALLGRHGLPPEQPRA
jgi:putative hydrolase of the HAD superfamily